MTEKWTAIEIWANQSLGYDDKRRINVNTKFIEEQKVKEAIEKCCNKKICALKKELGIE